MSVWTAIKGWIMSLDEEWDQEMARSSSPNAGEAPVEEHFTRNEDPTGSTPVTSSKQE